jgi:hypothetical protein
VSSVKASIDHATPRFTNANPVPAAAATMARTTMPEVEGILSEISARIIIAVECTGDVVIPGVGDVRLKR